MARSPIILESNLIPGSYGALPPNQYYTSPSSPTLEGAIENEDGSFTAKTYQLESNKPTFDLDIMQNIYGTKYMPMFQWVSQQETGSVTFDPQDDMIDEDEANRLRDEFQDEFGIDPAEALKQAGYATGATIGSRAGGALTALMDNGVDFGDAFVPTAKESLSLPFFDSKNPKPNEIKLKQIKTQQAADMKSGLPTSSADQTTSSLSQNMITKAPDPSYFGMDGKLMNRLNPGTDIGMQNLKMSGGAALGNWVGRMVAGQDPVRAAEEAGKSFGVQYAATALTGNPLIGAIAGQFAQPILKKVKKLFKKLF